MNRPKALDVYCCQGGASRGYADAGFDVYGIDIDPQPHYPFPFYQGDARDALRRLLCGERLPFTWPDGHIEWLGESDFVFKHGSPPCQLYSKTWRINKSDFPDLIAETRDLFQQGMQPWVIENVEDARAELRNPYTLCGAMFGLETYRHRLFEIAFPSFNSYKTFEVPKHPEHAARLTKMGRRPVEGEYMHIVGNFSGVDRARQIMGMPWATRDGLREAIPTIYAEFIGRQLIRELEVAA